MVACVRAGEPQNCVVFRSFAIHVLVFVFGKGVIGVL